MKLIDFENHFYDQCVMDALGSRTQYPIYNKEADTIQWSDLITMPQGVVLERLLQAGQERIDMMDKLGITTAVLSCAPGVEELDAETSVPLCRQVNDSMAALVKAFPGRYLGSAILPAKDVEAACAEMRRCVEELGFVGWHTHSNYCGTEADHPMYRPLFATANELGIYVYLHPRLPHNSRMDDYGFTAAGPGLGFTMDTMATITKMILSGLFDEFPDLKVILGHLGEALPFLLERMDNRLTYMPNPAAKNQKAFSHYFHHNIYVTTSGNMCPVAFDCTKRVLGLDRILFGSDYPFEAAEDMVNYVNNLELTDEERAQLYYKNGAAVGVTL